MLATYTILTLGLLCIGCGWYVIVLTRRCSRLELTIESMESQLGIQRKQNETLSKAVVSNTANFNVDELLPNDF